MASSPETTLARISELLDTVDSSSKVLRDFLKTEQKRLHTHEASESHTQRVADDLGLPFHADPKIVDQAAILRLACERLTHIATPPRHLVFEAATSFWTSYALEIVVKADVATLIDNISKKAHSEGAHIDLISQQCRLEGDFLARLLRHLSASGIFQELSPLVFANTIASSTLVDLEFRAHLGIGLHAGKISASFLHEYLSRRFEMAATAAAAGQPAEYPPELLAAWTIYSKGVPYFRWLQFPENAEIAESFNLGMRGYNVTEGLDFLPFDYPFAALPADTTIVDVGGGIGVTADLILPSAPHLRFVIQDLESVVTHGANSAKPDMKQWIADGRVRFQAQDFFEPQPRDVEGTVFFLKSVLHNYPDFRALQILTNVRQANPSRLLVVDRLVIPHLRTEASTAAGESEIYSKLRAGVKLQGETAEETQQIATISQHIPTIYDLYMGAFHGARTRTLDEWRALLLQGDSVFRKSTP